MPRRENPGADSCPFNTQERRSNYLAFVSPTHKLAFDIAIIVPGYKIKQSLILYVIFPIGWNI
jgi:hypothetical protein